jgi:hypothetical protein
LPDPSIGRDRFGGRVFQPFSGIASVIPSQRLRLSHAIFPK